MAKTRAEISRKYHVSKRGRANSLISNARNRAKTRGLEYELEISWVYEKLEEGYCEVTGLPFTFQCKEEYNKTNNAHPYSPTLDRTDNKKGYTKENTKVVVAVYNYAKMHWGHEHVVRLAQAIMEKENG